MNAALPFRSWVYGCIHPRTYKYFFSKDQVYLVWSRLEARYGKISQNGAFMCMQIESEFLIIRSTLGGNPITVIRKRGCKKEFIDELHAVVGYIGNRGKS